MKLSYCLIGSILLSCNKLWLSFRRINLFFHNFGAINKLKFSFGARNIYVEPILGGGEKETVIDHLLEAEFQNSEFDIAFRYGSDIIKTLEMMKVADLKTYLRRLGGSYSSKGIRKADIVQQCYQYLSLSNESAGNASVRSFSTSDEKICSSISSGSNYNLFLSLLCN